MGKVESVDGLNNGNQVSGRHDVCCSQKYFIAVQKTCKKSMSRRAILHVPSVVQKTANENNALT